MDRSRSSPTERSSTVRAFAAEPLHVVSASGDREFGEFVVDAADRRAVFAIPVLRFAADGLGAVDASCFGQPQAGAAADACDGNGGDLSEAADDAARSKSQDLPVFAASRGDRASRSCLVQRHNVRADAHGLHVPSGRDRLVQPLCALMAVVEHPGGEFLRRSVRDGSRTKVACDFQQRSRSSIHEPRICQPIGIVGGGDLDGRSRPSLGQRVHRTLMAKPEVRIDLLTRVRDGSLADPRIERVLPLLLPRTTAPGTGLSNACRTVSSERASTANTPRSISLIENRL